MKEISLPKANKLSLVGIGYRPLGKQAREIVRKADVILASSRLLDVFKRYNEYEAVKDRIKVIDRVPETVVYTKDWFAQAAHAPLVLLASGDPMFFGIGRRMVEEFGIERIEIIPDLSSMQEAFARINVPWDDAFSISVHGGPEIAKRRALPYKVKDIPWLIRKYPKIAVLTDRQNNPALIAGEIGTAPTEVRDGITLYVCERLGYDDERIWTGAVGEAAGMTFSEPNVMIILRTASGERSREIGFGLREEELEHRDGMITKDEVRAVSIHKLRLPSKGLLWDIGAGSGSVAIEAARLAPGLTVIAVERDEAQTTRIRANKMKFDVRNLKLIEGSAPDTLTDLGAPDRVFIGGSGGRLAEIVELASGRMQAGIIVINAATLETLQEGIAALERSGFATDVSEVSVSRSRIVAGKKMMSSMNPVFIMKGERGY
jgi:precorrin-6Y C5,15-methyltransferase (decarboxylating)